jgi:uncharacterized protein with HEPN domain
MEADQVGRLRDILTAARLIEARRQVPELPFRKMRGMRNIVAHDYANVDLGIVWEVATVHIPETRSVLETFFSPQDPPVA